MNKTMLLSALLSLGLQTREDAAVTPDLLTPWVDKHLPLLKEKAQALRDGATWTEVTALVDTTIKAGQELKPLVKGVPRARLVLTVVQLLVREFAPANAAWLTMLLNSGFAEQFIEMAFKRLFPKG